MRIAGNATLHAPAEAVYAALTDPAVRLATPASIRWPTPPIIPPTTASAS